MSDSTGYQEENLTRRGHEDPDKHWIGETLPSPSLAEATYAGIKTATGTSPFPARADHSHDNRQQFGIFNRITTQSIAAGATVYISGINFAGIGDDLRVPASTQLFEFSQEGVWDVHMLFAITRSTATFGVNLAYRISFDYDNATSSVVIMEGNLPEGRGRLVDTAVDQTWILNFGTMQNVQFKYQNFDSVAHLFSITRLNISRRNSLNNP